MKDSRADIKGVLILKDPDMSYEFKSIHDLLCEVSKLDNKKYRGDIAFENHTLVFNSISKSHLINVIKNVDENNKNEKI